MAKINSTVPGLTYFPERDDFMKTSFRFLEARRRNDGAEGLWRIGDNLYDLEGFLDNHPGGPEWLTLTKGTDITEIFMVHHISDKANQLLPKFFVREALKPRSLMYTFEPNGFYQTFKRRVQKALEGIDYRKPSVHSKRISDLLLTITMISAIAVALLKSWIAIVVTGLFLAWTTISAHNFFHLKDNFRMYYFDLSMMSSKDWRVSHILSHHFYPNTLWDMEIYSFEPFFYYLPSMKRLYISQVISVIISPVVYSLVFFTMAIRRYYSLFNEWKRLELREFFPFILPSLMSFFTSCPWEAVKLWILIILSGSFFFSFIGLTAAHHHPIIFHDGDTCRKDLDWGLMQLDAVRGRKIIDDSLFLSVTHFGSHSLHHLLPSLDHAYLKYCLPAFYETCHEFNINTNRLSVWELIKGQYRQLGRVVSRFNTCDNKVNIE